MTPEENLETLGVRRLPATPLCDKDVNPAEAADVNGEAQPGGPRGAETSSEQAEPDVEKDTEP